MSGKYCRKPPSSVVEQLTFDLLYDGPMTAQQIAEEAMLPVKAIYDALVELMCRREVTGSARGYYEQTRTSVISDKKCHAGRQ